MENDTFKVGKNQNVARKQMKSLRLSEATIEEILDLSIKYSISQSDAVAIAVHCVFKEPSDKFVEWVEIAKRT